MDASAEVKAQACTTTRKNKTCKTVEERESLEVTWRQRAEAVGIEHPQPKLRQNLEESYDRWAEAVEPSYYAVRSRVKCDRSVAFPRHKLLKETLRQSQGNYSLEELEQAIDRDRNLVKTKDGRLTTTQALGREVEILQNAQLHRDGYTPLATAKAAKEKAQQVGLNAAQENALVHFATNKRCSNAMSGRCWSRQDIYAQSTARNR